MAPVLTGWLGGHTLRNTPSAAALRSGYFIIMGASGGYGPLMDILLGIAGAIVGGFLLRLLGLYSSGGLVSTIIVAIIGAVFLIWLSRKLKKA